jgi:leucine efflux protein
LIYGITDITTFVLGTIFIVLLPGPNSLYVITLASKRGVAAGYWAAFGIFTGDTVLMLAAATGAASVLYASPAVFTALKLLGAAYLAWLGIGLVRSGFATWLNKPSSADLNRPTNVSLRGPASADLNRPANGDSSKSLGNDLSKPFRTAMIISLLNPKAIMFFVSFFVQFVDPNYAYPALSFLILGVIVQVASLLYLSALIFGGARLSAHFSQRPWLSASGTGLVGILFVVFAVRLAL